MNDKLKRFLDKINFSYDQNFDNLIIENVVVHRDSKEWDIYLKCDKIIDYDAFKLLIDHCEKGIDEVKKINLVCSINSFNNDDLKETIMTYFKQALIDFPSLRGISKDDFIFDNQNVVIDVTNKNEHNTMSKLTKKWLKRLEQFSITDVKFDVTINEEKRGIIKQAIAEEKSKSVIVKKTPKQKVVIYGRSFSGKPTSLNNILGPETNVVVEVFVFGLDVIKTSKENLKIITMKISDKTDSLYGKIFTRNDDDLNSIVDGVIVGSWYRIRGNVKDDAFSKDIVLNITDIESISSKDEIISDDAKEKRVELHTHTFMSQMDGAVDVKDLIKIAKRYGHKAIAITDHNCLQSYPEAYKLKDEIKIIYGAELNVIDDNVKIIINNKDYDLIEDSFVVFDTETTGFNAGGEDQMIEIGAVKIKDGIIVDRFSELIDPGKSLSDKTTEITGITNKMIKGKRTEQQVVSDFIVWYGDLPIVAHNASFDLSFLDGAIKKYNLKSFTNTLIDTVELSRFLNPDEKKHNLSSVVKRYEVTFDEVNHHRADYDAEATAMVFYLMAKQLASRKINTTTELLDNSKTKDMLKFSRPFHLTALVKNAVGLKNLFKIISLSNTKYLFKTPKIPRSVLNEYREGLLFGSSCMNGEIFSEARRKDDQELADLMTYYDYIEVQPPSLGSYLIDLKEFDNENELLNNIKKIIRVAQSINKMICATGDVHHLNPQDKIYREIIIRQNTPNVGRHPLNRPEIKEVPSFHFRTTTEMLEEFSFLPKELAKEIVITNPNTIADQVEEQEITKKGLYTPKMDNSDEITKKMVYEKAREIYGDPLPDIIEKRLEAELSGIIANGYSVLYLIAEKLVKKSNDDGYLVGSRGSVGSSFVATMMGITEVNPLPPHYLCNECKTSVFEIDNVSLDNNYTCGYDLPDLKCQCGKMMKKEGQGIPFATFLGFKAEKVPDIDLNFSSDNQANMHDYVKQLFGADYVFRAGTIGTVADKTAFGYVRGYMEEKNITLRTPEIERLANGCVGIKRTTGQHPGGIIVIPDYMDVYDFTSFQYPADDPNSSWYTTHFDFHAIHDNVLKLDILGHDDPTMLKYLQDISGIKIDDIPFDDSKVISLFNSCDILNVKKEQIGCPTGTLGVPEFGTNFAIRMLEETKPTTFMEIVKICGLAHGTDVWAGNVRDLIVDGIVTLKEVHGCRDDIMEMLIKHEIAPGEAFKISEFVRKVTSNIKSPVWGEYKEIMYSHKVPEWFIQSCEKIKYLFPKAHATAYVMMAYRVAWFKLYHPIDYYAGFFSIRCHEFDVETMINGKSAISNKISEIKLKKTNEITNKENDLLTTLEVANEMYCRGFSFKNIDLEKSSSSKFLIDANRESLIIPFKALEGLGETVAQKVIEEREKSAYVSIEDLQNRGKINSTSIDRLRALGVLNNIPESSQLSLF